MKTILAHEKKSLRNKAAKIYNLANSYHSVEGSSLSTDDQKILIDPILKEWQKVVSKPLIDKGWGDSSITTVIDLELAIALALRTLYKLEDKDWYEL